MDKGYKVKKLDLKDFQKEIEGKLKRLNEKWKRKKKNGLKIDELSYEPYEKIEDVIPFGHIRGKHEFKREILKSEIVRDYLFGGNFFVPDALFLDIETVSIGGSSYIAVFGVGGVYEEGFLIEQIALLNPKCYTECLREIKNLLLDKNFKVIVTYNGERFDLPFIKKHIDIDLKDKSSFDFFVFVKRFFEKDRFNTRRLSEVCYTLFSSLRGDDIHPYYFKSIYLKYLESGDRDYIDLILKHNREDILDTFFLFLKVEDMIKNDELTDYNKFGLSEHLLKLGKQKEAREVFFSISRNSFNSLSISKNRLNRLLKAFRKL